MFNKKKQHFTKSLADLNTVIWESEFMRYKTLYTREQLRQEHDLAVEAIARISASPDLDKNEETKKDKELSELRLKSITEQMTSIDNEQIPGIDAKIQGLQELKPLIEKFIKIYC